MGCGCPDTMGTTASAACPSSEWEGPLSGMSTGASPGCAVSPLTADMRLLGEAEGMPELPLSSIVLLRNERSQSQVSETLAEHIVEGFRL